MIFHIFRYLKQYKLYYLFVFMALVSCSGDGEDNEVDNPVLGIWNNYEEQTDNLMMTRVFTFDYYSYFTFAEGKKQDKLNKQHYEINATHIFLDKYTQSYKLVDDTLWITNQKGDQITKYIRGYW